MIGFQFMLSMDGYNISIEHLSTHSSAVVVVVAMNPMKWMDYGKGW